MSGVLDGVKVLDLSQGIAGPMATMVLSDQGADVIKIETPEGDPWWDIARLGYRAWQRGKRNAIFDFTSDDDYQQFLDLVKTADVLVESFSPGITDELRIDYATLSQVNPRLVYCSITGYGRDNELSDRPAIDALVAARVGLHYEQRGRVGGVFNASGAEIPFEDIEFNPEAVVGPRHHDRDGPVFTGTHWPSAGAAYAALTSISGALFVRAQTGQGQWVETSLVQGALTAGTLAFSRADKPDAPHFATWINDSRSPKGNFRCKDGRWVINWVCSPSFVLGASQGETLDTSPDMGARDDPDRIMPALEDMLVLDHYYPMLSEAFERFTADEWTDAGAVAGQCIQKIVSPEEALNDTHFLEDGCVVDVLDPELGPTRQVGTLYCLEKNPCKPREGIASPGEHSQAVRSEAAEHSGPATASDRAMPPKPLAGIKVIDLGLAIAGPFGAQVLSDLGADVIKVNATYDWYWHSNCIAMSANRGKRSIAINMRDPKGVALIQDLCRDADVVIHNMRYKAVEGKGLDYASLSKINPRLIYCHTRGFEKGPREPLPGNDQTGSALSGVQWEDGACNYPGGRPYWTQTTLGDTGNGYLAAVAIIQALTEREKTGEGQFVDTSIVNAQLFNCSHIIAKNDGSGFERPMLQQDALGFSAGYRLYKTTDKYLCLALLKDTHWQALFTALELTEEAGKHGYQNRETREKFDKELTDLIQSALSKDSADSWFARLDTAGVPCEISEPDFMRSMWQEGSFMLERGWLVNLPHPVTGRIGHVGVPYQFSHSPASVQFRPLIVGEATRQILTELGYTEQQQNELFDAQVVADASCHPYELNLETA
ncbi:MAG: CoA transferase [Halieaceae bacterium]|jgi:crotonobetainyl-CoA:carnitine CoA-transferase CaiB-like acyl-CoA transferase|nr:CoA transferase [Halieaceae bacterium]